jgi:hypothetical protein
MISLCVHPTHCSDWREGGNFCTHRDGVRFYVDLGLPIGNPAKVWQGMGSFILQSMKSNDLLSLIDAEMAHLHRARAILAPLAKPARSAGSSEAPSKTIPAVKPRKRRKMSPEARARIADAQKRRWAKQRANQKTKP